MAAKISMVLALAFLLTGILLAGEAPAIAVGSVAPALEGSAWVTADGKEPDLKGKVQLIEFWAFG